MTLSNNAYRIQVRKCSVKIYIGQIWGDCELPSILGNGVGPAVIEGRVPPTIIILKLGKKRKPFQVVTWRFECVKHFSEQKGRFTVNKMKGFISVLFSQLQLDVSLRRIFLSRVTTTPKLKWHWQFSSCPKHVITLPARLWWRPTNNIAS